MVEEEAQHRVERAGRHLVDQEGVGLEGRDLAFGVESPQLGQQVRREVGRHHLEAAFGERQGEAPHARAQLEEAGAGRGPRVARVASRWRAT